MKKIIILLLAAIVLTSLFAACSKEPVLPEAVLTVGEDGKGEEFTALPVASAWHSGKTLYETEAPHVLSPEAERMKLIVEPEQEVYITFGKLSPSVLEYKRWDSGASEGDEPFDNLGVGGFIAIPKKAQDYIFSITAYFGDNNENHVTYYIEIVRP